MKTVLELLKSYDFKYIVNSVSTHPLCYLEFVEIASLAKYVTISTWRVGCELAKTQGDWEENNISVQTNRRKSVQIRTSDEHEVRWQTTGWAINQKPSPYPDRRCMTGIAWVLNWPWTWRSLKKSYFCKLLFEKVIFRSFIPLICIKVYFTEVVRERNCN